MLLTYNGNTSQALGVYKSKLGWGLLAAMVLLGGISISNLVSIGGLHSNVAEQNGSVLIQRQELDLLRTRTSLAEYRRLEDAKRIEERANISEEELTSLSNKLMKVSSTNEMLLAKIEKLEQAQKKAELAQKKAVPVVLVTPAPKPPVKTWYQKLAFWR